MIRRFITWLYERYVLVPTENGLSEITQELYVTFEPDPEFDAQIEKNVTKPSHH